MSDYYARLTLVASVTKVDPNGDGTAEAEVVEVAKESGYIQVDHPVDSDTRLTVEFDEALDLLANELDLRGFSGANTNLPYLPAQSGVKEEL